MDQTEYNERTCIIVLQIKGKNKAVEVGVVVDEVSEVLNINASEIEDTPSCGIDIDKEYILAMAKMNRGVKTLLNVDGLLGGSASQLIEHVA